MNERIFAMAHLADQGVLFLLVALAVASIIMIMERWRFLSKVMLKTKAHQRTIENAIATRNLGSIRDIASDLDSIEGKAMSFALDKMKSGNADGIEEVFSAISQVERPKLERSLGFLATVGSNAPYIGLFGTVLGIMKAFADMANASDAGQQTVMAGISAALIATAAGLMVAIPAVLAYNYFQKQVKLILSNLDACRDMALAYHKQGPEVQSGR